jgi:hypothetical protein
MRRAAEQEPALDSLTASEYRGMIIPGIEQANE